jgi:hypothetical protein
LLAAAGKNHFHPAKQRAFAGQMLFTKTANRNFSVNSMWKFGRAVKKAPNSKPQHPEKLQAPKHPLTFTTAFAGWNFGVSLELGCWCLELFNARVLRDIAPAKC